MRLCIVTSSVKKGDGQARVNYEITKAAIQEGHNVTLVVRQQVANDLKGNQLISCIDFSVENIPTYLMREIVFTQQVNRWLRKNGDEFDVIMACGAVTSQKTDVNVVHFVHSTWLNSPFHTFRISKNLYGAYQWFYTWLNSRWEKQAFKSTKVLVAVSETIKQELIEIGFPEEKIQVILNGVDLDEFAPDSRDRAQFGLPSEVNLALFVGDFRTNRKNLDSVLKALVDVPNLHLAVVGSAEKSPYPQLAKQLQVDHRVHFLGYRADVAKIMQVVDFFVFPSRYEPFGMVVSEAMASGLPVITTSVSGVAAIVTPESGIVLTDSENVQALVDALVLLTDRPELRIKMGKSARAIAEQHSWISKANAYIDLFESLRS
ncbi:MAG: glycosyl transferase [Oscillatoriales cyanobacterium CG2_30_44_21]|nr:MAG: glycosyl transferase [Oscillatoriales cyanobacterium CG2_30_44_21]